MLVINLNQIISENAGGNKPEPLYNQQQSPEGSNGKLIDDIFNDFGELKPNNKGYILLLNNYVSNNGSIMKIKLTMNPRDIKFEPKTLLKSVYRGDNTNEPQTPKIDKNTGKITDGKG